MLHSINIASITIALTVALSLVFLGSWTTNANAKSRGYVTFSVGGGDGHYRQGYYRNNYRPYYNPYRYRGQYYRYNDRYYRHGYYPRSGVVVRFGSYPDRRYYHKKHHDKRYYHYKKYR